MMRSDWFEWFRAADIKPYSIIACVLLKYLCLSPQRCQSTKSRKCFDGDNEVNWRHDMPSNIIYAYIKKGAMLDKLDITLLLNSKFLGNRFWWYWKMKFERIFWTSNEFKSFKNSIFEVLPSRMLFKEFVREND